MQDPQLIAQDSALKQKVKCCDECKKLKRQLHKFKRLVDNHSKRKIKDRAHSAHPITGAMADYDASLKKPNYELTKRRIKIKVTDPKSMSRSLKRSPVSRADRNMVYTNNEQRILERRQKHLNTKKSLNANSGSSSVEAIRTSI